MPKIRGTYPSVGFLDDRYVNVTGDTMTGNLVFNDELYIEFGNTDTRLAWNDSGNFAPGILLLTGSAGTATERIIASIGDLTLYSHTDTDGSGDWSPSITLSTTTYGIYYDVSAPTQASANLNAYGFRVKTALAEAASGTHALLAGTRFNTPAITAGSATVTDVATVQIEGAPVATVTGGTYALLVGAGASRFGGVITVDDNNLLGTPIPGTFEFDNDRMYVTNVGTQRAIDRTSDVITSTTTVANTTTETTIYTGTVGANDMKAGNVMKVNVNGVFSAVSAADTVTGRVKIGSTTVATLTSSGSGVLTDEPWHMEVIFTVRTVGSSGSIAVHGDLELDGTTDFSSIETINTTIAENITITVQWNNAKAGNSVSIYQGFFEFKN